MFIKIGKCGLNALKRFFPECCEKNAEIIICNMPGNSPG
jgi:hypothetical protein